MPAPDESELRKLLYQRVSPDGRIRVEAGDALELVSFKELRPFVLATLRDPDPSLREGMVEALEQPKYESYLPELIAAFDDPVAQIRAAVAAGLGGANRDAALPVLQRALFDEDIGVRREAAKSLYRTPNPAATPHLSRALFDAEVGVRYKAAKALHELMIEEEVKQSWLDVMDTALLQMLIQDDDPSCKSMAGMTLAFVASPTTALELIRLLSHQSELVREAAQESLILWEDLGVAMPALKTLSDGPDESIRARAITVLCQRRVDG